MPELGDSISATRPSPETLRPLDMDRIAVRVRRRRVIQRTAAVVGGVAALAMAGSFAAALQERRPSDVALLSSEPSHSPAAATATSPPHAATVEPSVSEPAWHQEPGTWELTEGSIDGEPINVPAGSRVTLAVEGDVIGGTAACNGYGGEIRVDGDRVTIGSLGSTAMGCAAAVVTAEEQFLEALPRVSGASRDGDLLTLKGAGVGLVFTLQAPVAIDDVVGHVWVLETITDGDTSWSPVGRPTLQLLEDGTLTGTTGCRELYGRYVVSGDHISTPELGAEGGCPADLHDQDNQVIFLVEGSFRATVEGDRLMLNGDGGPDGVYVRQPAGLP